MNKESSSCPAVTVVIPAYNLEKYLADCVRSVINQTYAGPIKIIVLDDGSQDQTLEVAKALATEFDQIEVHTQQNKGRVAARNRLLDLASSELVAWIDADDIASPRWLQDQVSVLVHNKDVVAVSGQGYAMTADAYPIGPIVRHPLDHASIIERHLQGHANAFFQSCVTVRKSAVVAAGGYSTRFPAAEDYDLWLRLSEHGQLNNVDHLHLIYRIHATSANATISIQQRRQGWQSGNEARDRLGLKPLPWSEETIPAPRKDEWNRRVYWLNIALRSGNPWTGLRMAVETLRRYPMSMLVTCLTITALLDTVLFLGNRTDRFNINNAWTIRDMPHFSFYNVARRLYFVMRRLRRL